MVTHIVLFKFKEKDREANVQKAGQMLSALLESVPELKSIEVGTNFSNEERAMDLSIITTFDDRDGLEQYVMHTEHMKVVEFIKSVVEESKVVDYIS
ncbi:MAG: Dabb family protein [Campylobacterota bacterium]|nr:Dabb family protein [Campylobacterota bacterium]